ncbi:MAG: hypothetical protein GX896_02340 [Clostridiales bacterium]|nr:hypothetical protein [Clostridiales bacterium]
MSGKHEKGNGKIFIAVIIVFAIIIGIFALINLMFNINGDEVGLVDGVCFNMSVSEMKKISGKDYELYDETQFSDCRNYVYNTKYADKNATLVYIMEKKTFGFRLKQFQLNVIDGDKETFDSIKKTIAKQYSDDKNFSEGKEVEADGVTTLEMGTVKNDSGVLIQMSLKDGYISINIEKK